MAASSHCAASQGESSELTMCTPIKSHFPELKTPKRSERKRALFPTTSPQTSDLGHISPLGSSPDRYSSAPASPDSLCFSPVKSNSGLHSPFGRKHITSSALQVSPRRRFSELFKHDLRKSSILTLNSSLNVSQSHLSSSKDLVPADQLEQTLLSIMEDSECVDSSISLSSQRTPNSTPLGVALLEAESEEKHIQPLTPSKRHSRFIPTSSSGSTTSASPQSPKRNSLLPSEPKSKAADVPRARLSLFSENASTKREKYDKIYLTGRSSKTRKNFGQINAGVRTGIRRPPKAKSKIQSNTQKHSTKIKSELSCPRQSHKRKSSSIILPKMSMFPKLMKFSSEEQANLSASVSMRVHSKKRMLPDDEGENDQILENSNSEPSSTKKVFKTRPLKKKRVATVTVNDKVKVTFSQGKFTVQKSDSSPPFKRKRKLFDREKQIAEVNTFEDVHEDVADCTRKEVMVILKKLDEEDLNNKCKESGTSKCNQTDFLSRDSPVYQSSLQEDLQGTVQRSVSSSPLSPLSELASSTSTLSLNIGGDTLHLKESQVQALSQVPDLIMEEDDVLLSQPTEEVHDVSDRKQTESATPSLEMKENELNVTNVQVTSNVEFFPIFNGKSHQGKECEKPATGITQKRKHSAWRPVGNDQYQIDAGQKKFGAKTCSECNIVYQVGDPEDEIVHAEFHRSLKELKHPGWKKENVIGKFGSDYVIVVNPGDPKHWWARVLEILSIIDKSLGFYSRSLNDLCHKSKAYLYVSNKRIVGCVVAQPLKTAFRMLLSESDIGGIDCCSKEEYPVKSGVSRIWVHEDYRRRHIASYLMDCVRKTFLFGSAMSLEDIAFSSPTNSGKKFAENYTGHKDYLAYASNLLLFPDSLTLWQEDLLCLGMGINPIFKILQEVTGKST